MNIEELVEQYRKAYNADSGEKLTGQEIGEIRSACERIARFREDNGLQVPVGYVGIESLDGLIRGNDKPVPEITPHPDSEAPAWPTFPVYLLSPVDVMAHTLAQIILLTEEEGPLSADDLRAVYQFMIPGEGEAS